MKAQSPTMVSTLTFYTKKVCERVRIFSVQVLRDLSAIGNLHLTDSTRDYSEAYACLLFGAREKFCFCLQ